LLLAGKLAGLQTVRLIREPVAAALAYGLDLTEEQVGLLLLSSCSAAGCWGWFWCINTVMLTSVYVP
jgi:hypothetical protein